jgi:cell wall-associated NlpC family hydrolase
VEALAAAQRLADAQVQEEAAHAAEALAKTSTTTADQNLRQAALDAYLDVLLPKVSHADPATTAYEMQIAGVYRGAAVKTAAQRVRDVHNAERHLREVEQQVAAATKQAETEAAAALATDSRAKVAATRAAAQQNKLVAILDKVPADVAALMAGQKAILAVAAYSRISRAGTLLFTPGGPLPGQLPETAKAISTATAQIGKWYVWGAAGPDTFDCSGLMQWSWAQVGVRLPRVAADQQAWAVPVPISQVQPGDLVFFGIPAHHVGMYVGNGLMVEAPHSGAMLDLTSIWWDDLAGFGRVHQ